MGFGVLACCPLVNTRGGCAKPIPLFLIRRYNGSSSGFSDCRVIANVNKYHQYLVHVANLTTGTFIVEVLVFSYLVISLVVRLAEDIRSCLTVEEKRFCGMASQVSDRLRF
jgi:hypothetical protein